MNKIVKIIVLITLLGGMAVNVFAGGWFEKKKDNNSPENKVLFVQSGSGNDKINIKQVPLIMNLELGVVTTKLFLKNKDEIIAIILRKQDTDDTKYINPYTEYEIDGNSAEDLFLSTPDNGQYSVDSQNVSELLVSDYWKGQCSVSISGQLLANLAPGKGSEIIITTPLNSKEVFYDILIVYTSNEYERYAFTFIPDFFDNENTLYSSLTNVSKELFALYALSKIEGIRQDADFSKLLNEFDTTTAALDSIENTLNSSANKDMVSGIGMSLKKALLQNLPFKNNIVVDGNNRFILPEFLFASEQFDKIYSNTGSPYIKAFLVFLFIKNKPIYSNYMATELGTKGINFNYKEYQKLTPQQNNSIANNTLRYLTWGVDYQVSTGFSSNYQQRAPGQKVKKEEVTAWLANADDNDRIYNYLHQTPEIVLNSNAAVSTNILTSQLAFMTEQNNLKYTSFDAFRIDIWTSKNIAWNNNIINRVWENDNLIDAPLLYNGLISDQDVQTHVFNRVDAEPRNFSFGLQFSSTQKVQAICVAGIMAATLGIKPETLASKYQEILRIKYKTSSNADWQTISGAGGANNEPAFFEYVSLPVGEIFEYDRYGKERLPGYGLFATMPKNKAGQLQFSYLILNTPVNCTDICISLPYNNPRGDLEIKNRDSLKITEIMVFPENPLDGFEYCENEDYFGRVCSSSQELPQIFRQTQLGGNNLSVLGANPYLPFRASLANSVNIKQLILWTKPDSAVHSIQKRELFYNPVTKEVNFTGQPTMAEENWQFNFETPFRDNSTGKYVIGNPLPFALGGIDSPRTFAYKMDQQVSALEKYIALAKIPRSIIFDNANQILNFQSYADEIEWYLSSANVDLRKIYSSSGLYMADYPHSGNKITHAGGVIKPFLPGLVLDKQDKPVVEINSPYSADKIAGVDSLGMLSGSIAMASGLDNIRNVFNESIGETLNHYYRMTSADSDYKGLDNDGKPVFYNGHYTGASGDALNSFLDERAYRFTKSDLEHSSVIVPDISLIQVGDLLVNYSIKGDPHVGIVVALDWNNAPPFGSNAEDFWDEVLVVSIRKGFQTASLGRWGTLANGIFNGFTDSPKDYHIRRLIENPVSEPTEPTLDTWEIFNDRIKRVENFLTLADDPYMQSPNHWIPNTSELLKGINIKIFAYDKNGNKISDFTKSEEQIKILPPIDRFYRSFENDSDIKSNIYVNKGTGFEFYAIATDGGTVRLANFELNPYADTDNEFNRYKVIYNPNYFEVDGTPKVDYNLIIVGEDLKFISPLSTNGISEFGIKAIGNIRPGDDIFLRFGLLNVIGVEAIEARQNDFLAVYDKKIIWRANLYIDEGANDWNNLHPWIEGNDWNINDAGDPIVGENAGKQVVSIKPWTRINDDSYCPGGNVQNKVAYSWGSRNSPFEFNNGMEAQKDIITQKRAIDSDYNEISWNNDTYAPGSNWNNYVHPERAENTLPFKYSDIKINNQDYHPLIPGLTNYSLFYGLRNPNTNAYNFAQTEYSLGVECEGFVWRTKGYRENNRFVYNDKYEALEFIERHNVVYQNAIPKADFYKDGDFSISIPLVPGDVVKLDGHIMMVFLLKDIEDDGGVKFNNIVFVEAASGFDRQYHVLNSQDLWNYILKNPSKTWYEFKRLRRNY